MPKKKETVIYPLTIREELKRTDSEIKMGGRLELTPHAAAEIEIEYSNDTGDLDEPGLEIMNLFCAHLPFL